MLNEFLMSSVFSFGVSIFLALILKYMGSSKWIHRIKERWNKEDGKVLRNIFSAVLIVIVLIGGAIILIVNFSGLTFYNNNDVSNWVTLTVEIGVGIVMAVIILIYSLSREKATAKDVTEHMDRWAAFIGGTTGGATGGTIGGTMEDPIPYKADDKLETTQKGKNDGN